MLGISTHLWAYTGTEKDVQSLATIQHCRAFFPRSSGSGRLWSHDAARCPAFFYNKNPPSLVPWL